MLSLLALTASAWLSPPPADIPASWTSSEESSSMDRLTRELTVGTSFTALTVTVNVSTVLLLSPPEFRSPSRPPSSTVTVIVAVPDWSATGANEIEPVELAEV